MNSNDAYRLELQCALTQAEIAGDIDAAEMLQSMIDDFNEYAED